MLTQSVENSPLADVGSRLEAHPFLVPRIAAMVCGIGVESKRDENYFSRIFWVLPAPRAIVPARDLLPHSVTSREEARSDSGF
jgi:hypothetical protein